MKLTIIVDDEYVAVDNVGFEGIDMSGLDPNLHAVQWDGSKGEVEYKDGTMNDDIYNIDSYQFIIDRWQTAKDYQDFKDADPFYDLTVEEARDFKIEQIMASLIEHRAEVYDDGVNRLSPMGVQTIEQLSALALLVRSEGDTIWTTDVILADLEANGTNRRVTLTATQIITKVRNLRQRNEDLNQAAQDHIDNVTLLVSVPTIRNYDITFP